MLGTIQRSQFAPHMKSQQNDLVSWVAGIHSGIYPHLVRPHLRSCGPPLTYVRAQQTTGLFNNYADDSSTFADASGTALLAASVYRLALMAGVHTHLPAAEKSRAALFASNSSSSSSSSSSSASSSASSSSSSNTSSLAHFTSAGLLTPVVDPNSFHERGSTSPEGQAFVLELAAAHADWVAAGSPGANAAARSRPGAWHVLLIAAALAAGVLA